MMDKLMNVVFMGNLHYPHGMAGTKRIQHFIDYLVQESISVKILLLRQGGVNLQNAELEGTHKGIFFRTIGNDVKPNILVFFTLAKYFIQGLTTLGTWVQVDKKNILFCYSGLSVENFVFVLFAKLLGYSIVFDIVEDGTHFHEKTHMLARIKHIISEKLDRYTIRLASGIITVSNYLRDIYVKKACNNIPVVLIPVSATINNHNEKKVNYSNPIKIVYTGTFAEKDGVELLIEAFGNISKINGNCVLLLTGNGYRLPLIKDRIVGNTNIKYIGYLNDDEFYRFLKEADVMCITRTGSEFANAGFPFKLGEYLATGNPVIVSDVSDVSCYLENMRDALIVQPDNVKQIQKALEYCIDNPDAARTIGENGRNKCERYFNPLVNGQHLIKLFQAVK